MVKLGDFGESLKLDDPTEPASRGYTPTYLAPEWDEVVHPRWGGRCPPQLVPKDARQRDLYAFGMVFYNLLVPSRTRHPRAAGAATARDGGPAWPSAAEAGDPLYATMARLPGVVTK